MRKVWRQTWVDSSGLYLALEGVYEDDQIILNEVSDPRPDFPNLRQRMVFSDFKGDSFTWEWQFSTDKGETWNLSWRLNYTRKK